MTLQILKTYINHRSPNVFLELAYRAYMRSSGSFLHLLSHTIAVYQFECQNLICFYIIHLHVYILFVIV